MSLNCQGQFQFSNHCSCDTRLHQQNCLPFFHLPFSCLLVLPLPVCDSLRGQALVWAQIEFSFLHTCIVFLWCLPGAMLLPPLKGLRELRSQWAGWLDCASSTHRVLLKTASPMEGLQLSRVWSASSEKLHLDSQGWLCWGEGILDVIGRQACRKTSVQALFCCFVWLCVSVCLCVKVLLVTNLGYYLKLWGWGGISFLNLVESLVGSMSLRLSVELKWNQGVYSWQKFICFFLEKGVREGVKNRALWMLKILVKPVFNDTSVN